MNRLLHDKKQKDSKNRREKIAGEEILHFYCIVITSGWKSGCGDTPHKTSNQRVANRSTLKPKLHKFGNGDRSVAEHIDITAVLIIIPAVDDSLCNRYSDNDIL